ncbi:hypothetical protein EmuJ_000729700 [Echinococcus multilocularis]|uniref:Uncharacterized protein n=1 Tax=Echinococcus multilocularis TaxID=6211 RepID=A0A068YBR3_ECHMU|nr:hypothetical protein EmuJ_000729700 [Echinococcus multilocularis]
MRKQIQNSFLGYQKSCLQGKKAQDVGCPPGFLDLPPSWATKDVKYQGHMARSCPELCHVSLANKLQMFSLQFCSPNRNKVMYHMISEPYK